MSKVKETTRLPNGISTDVETGPLAGYGSPSPFKWHTYFNDFDTYVAGDWTVTRVGTTPTEALADGDGGLLLLTMAATDDSSSALQKKGESFRWAPSKRLVFVARFKVSDATQSDFVLGLQITDTTPGDVTDGIFFQKDDGDANLDFHLEKNNTQTSKVAFSTITADTFTELAFVYEGLPRVDAGTTYYDFLLFKDGVRVATLSGTTNVCDDEDLTVSILMQNGEAVAKTMTIDYIFAAKER